MSFYLGHFCFNLIFIVDYFLDLLFYKRFLSVGIKRFITILLGLQNVFHFFLIPTFLIEVFTIKIS